MPIYTRELSILPSDLEDVLFRLFRKMCLNELTGCFEWTASKRNGYGRMGFDGRVVDVHRLMLACFYDELPTCIESAHLCHNRSCFNPGHLEPQVHKVNMAESQRARPACRRGHPHTPENTGYGKKGIRYCKRCNNDNVRRWATENRERVNELSRQSYARIGRSDRRHLPPPKPRSKKDPDFFLPESERFTQLYPIILRDSKS